MPQDVLTILFISKNQEFEAELSDVVIKLLNERADRTPSIPRVERRRALA
jgi:hypothetical protein